MIAVNDVTIASERVLQEMQYHPAPSKEQAEYQAATTLVLGELLRQRAAELGLEVRDMDDPTADDDHIEQLIKREVHIPEATRDECLAYFQANPELFVTSPLLDVSHILIAGDPKDEAQRAYAHDIAERLLSQIKKAPQDFGKLAKAHSNCDSSGAGGSLGQIGKGQTVQEFERQVFRAGTGLIKSLVETRYGYHIVQIHQKVDGKPLDFEMAYERIRDYLNEKVRRKAISQYINTLMAGARIEGIELNVTRSPLMQ
ncbi:peptidylprolyl isomerase [Marinobacter sp.]|uniref:peptidylprolyl isomerase n=1 Tax=Marinobacter sp. TaxID=50741 RepID=UPI003A91651D